MFVPRLDVMKPDKYRSVPTIGFLNENDMYSLANLQCLENCRQVYLLLWAFSRLLSLPSYSHYQLAFSGGKEGQT